MLDQLLPGEDKRTGATLLQAFRKAGIETHLKRKVEKVAAAGDELAVTLDDGSELRAAAALVSVGRRPVSRDLGYEEAGVAIGTGGFVVADETLRTGAAGVFAAGDLAGPPLLAHWAYHEGAIAAENAVGGGDRAVDRSVVPNAVFSHPEVASFGLTEDKARAESIQVSVAHVRFNGNSKAVLEGENDGFVRIVYGPEDRVVVGASLVGPHVTELVHEIALAAHAGLTIDAVMDTIHAHPTLSEAVGEAALGAGGRAMHSL
jgi:dihydrolipoamide dehydrogenase